MTPITRGERLGLLGEHVPQRLRLLAKAAVTAEDVDERNELDRQALALVHVALDLGLFPLLDVGVSR